MASNKTSSCGWVEMKIGGGHAPLLLQKLGFSEVAPMEGGVYHLKKCVANTARPTEYIAILYSPEPLNANTRSLQLFLQRVPHPLPIDMSTQQIQKHWQIIDARRLEESGLEPVTLTVSANEEWNRLQLVEYARPGDTGRIRHCVQLLTGDVVCYN